MARAAKKAAAKAARPASASRRRRSGATSPSKTEKRAAPRGSKKTKTSQKSGKKTRAASKARAVAKPAKKRSAGAGKAVKKSASKVVTDSKARAAAKTTAKPKGRGKRSAPPARPKQPPAGPPPRPRVPSAAERERIKAARELKQAEERQANQYDTAVKHFNARRFDKALPYFQKAADGPQPTLRHRARIHAEICRQQKQSSKVKLRTADEYYNYGVKLMNERRLKEAERHLSEALKLQPKASHIHLATAALGALSGDTKSVYRSLKRAIELDPRNRVLALNDADFSGVLADPSIAELLHASGTTN